MAKVIHNYQKPRREDELVKAAKAASTVRDEMVDFLVKQREDEKRNQFPYIDYLSLITDWAIKLGGFVGERKMIEEPPVVTDAEVVE